MGELTSTRTEVLGPSADAGFITTRAADLLAWAQKYSLFMYPFVTACCGMEFMSVSGPRYDFSRFGSEAPRFSPRQADLLWVVGTISQRQAPVLRRIYEQMAEPKYVVAMGSCANTGGLHADSYSVLRGIDKILPVDVYIPGCPPRPEALLHGLMTLQRRIDKQTLRRGKPNFVFANRAGEESHVLTPEAAVEIEAARLMGIDLTK